jgi:LCP family protein required for cell wall assembly
MSQPAWSTGDTGTQPVVGSPAADDGRHLGGDADDGRPPGGDPDDGQAPGGDRDAEAPPRARYRWSRLLLLISALVLVLVLGGVAGGWFYTRSVERTVARVDVFGALPEAGRPAKTASAALNVLVLGRDSTDPDPTGSRADTIILVHLPANRERAQLISIPRDTWTTLPTGTGGGSGGTKAKINAAYAWGGAPLMVRAVERFTGVRVDHLVLVDFAGFREIVDALGGIDIDVSETFTSAHAPFRTFHAGRQRMDGATALDFARQRKQFRDGDFTRMRHQQQVIAALVDRATERGLVTSPGRLDDFLKATAGTVTVDHTLSPFDLAWELRGIRDANIDRLTSPSAGITNVGDESVVQPDERAAKELYAAVLADDVAGWLKTHPNR